MWVEVLVPDFQGSHAAVETVMEAGPEVFNHNTETVPRLYRQVRLERATSGRWTCWRMRAKWRRRVPRIGCDVGLGERDDEVVEVMRDLRAHSVGILTLGQYLRPSPKHLP